MASGVRIPAGIHLIDGNHPPMTLSFAPERIETWPQRVAAITGDQGMEALRAVMGPDQGTATGVLLPEGLGVDDPAPAVAATAVTPPSSEGTVH